MLLFDEKAFSGDSRGWITTLHEIHNELAATKRSLRDALAREDQWRRRSEMLERALARRR